jgi:hypothetical protein
MGWQQAAPGNDPAQCFSHRVYTVRRIQPAHRTATPRDVPGSRPLLTDRAAMLQSGSPPGVWSAQPAACLQPFCKGGRFSVPKFVRPSSRYAWAIRSRHNAQTLRHPNPTFRARGRAQLVRRSQRSIMHAAQGRPRDLSSVATPSTLARPQCRPRKRGALHNRAQAKAEARGRF